ncbi:TIGR02301 family protein [Hansschlegelia quercus]|uniref:TIGR02301 family protein n=1 Tax=Hansschlegelia quercus TaxID=2528245 RepID=A0A4Q9GK12_9HYPH|nr:TIGR02301 family protein [Hansschlegelia quercus]TBN54689.1 TIGR02301 family protein [Hansschlegelia quercus]
MTGRVIAVSLVAIMLAATNAIAQGDRKPHAPAEPAPPAVDAAPPAPPPYEPQLMRLAEVLGALHHLRTVCGAADADIWRDRLAALIEAEAPSPDRRDRLAGAFNASFRTWARSYRSCTPSAKLAIDRFLGEAGRIAEDVRVRYGP